MAMLRRCSHGARAPWEIRASSAVVLPSQFRRLRMDVGTTGVVSRLRLLRAVGWTKQLAGMRDMSFRLGVMALVAAGIANAAEVGRQGVPDLAKSSGPGLGASKALVAEPFDLKEVRLLDGPFRDAMLRDKAYLLSLDPDRLLVPFYVNYGLPTSVRPYGGWEEPNCEVRGHCLGHYLSACALMYASTGDEELRARTARIVTALAKCQAAAVSRGFHTNYLAAFPESFLDRVETGKPVWVPWYTLHKIYAGLLDTYRVCGNQEALDVLQKAVDWVRFRVDHLSEKQMQAALETEHGGMVEVLANLYAVTGNPEHLRLARAFEHHRVFDPLGRREDRLDGLHANTQIPKLIGVAREYEVTGDGRYRDIAEYFWERVALRRSYVIGGHSDHEHFFPISDFGKHVGPETAETCNTYNLLKLTRHLFGWNPNEGTMNFYERALYNHILASQDPERGMFVYLMSLKPGHFKTYSEPEDSFWCCVGTGMENHAKYGDTIYSRGKDALYVNLFIASELNWKERGLVVRQETRFPESDEVRLSLKCAQPITGTVKIRYPRWVAGPMTVAVNGERQPVNGLPGAYVGVTREWRDGDRIELRVPMGLRCEKLPGEEGVVALLYGPIVLAGELGTNGVPRDYAKGQLDLVRVASPEVPVFVGNVKELLEQTRPVPGQALRFRTHGIGHPEDVTLAPFYQVHHQRYAVYWRLLSRAGWDDYQAKKAVAEQRRQELAARTVDRVIIGDAPSEAEHQFKGEKTDSGNYGERTWRHAVEGGWFSYRLKPGSGEPVALVCTYFGDDAGPRVFDIMVEGEKVATQKLERNRPGEFFEVEYPLAASLIQEKATITVRFQGHPGNFAGGVFGCAIRKQGRSSTSQ